MRNPVKFSVILLVLTMLAGSLLGCGDAAPGVTPAQSSPTCFIK